MEKILTLILTDKDQNEVARFDSRDRIKKTGGFRKEFSIDNIGAIIGSTSTITLHNDDGQFDGVDYANLDVEVLANGQSIFTGFVYDTKQTRTDYVLKIKDIVERLLKEEANTSDTLYGRFKNLSVVPDFEPNPNTVTLEKANGKVFIISVGRQYTNRNGTVLNAQIALGFTSNSVLTDPVKDTTARRATVFSSSDIGSYLTRGQRAGTASSPEYTVIDVADNIPENFAEVIRGKNSYFGIASQQVNKDGTANAEVVDLRSYKSFLYFKPALPVAAGILFDYIKVLDRPILQTRQARFYRLRNIFFNEPFVHFQTVESNDTKNYIVGYDFDGFVAYMNQNRSTNLISVQKRPWKNKSYDKELIIKSAWYFSKAFSLDNYRNTSGRISSFDNFIINYTLKGVTQTPISVSAAGAFTIQDVVNKVNALKTDIEARVSGNRLILNFVPGPAFDISDLQNISCRIPLNNPGIAAITFPSRGLIYTPRKAQLRIRSAFKAFGGDADLSGDEQVRIIDIAQNNDRPFLINNETIQENRLAAGLSYEVLSLTGSTGRFLTFSSEADYLSGASGGDTFDYDPADQVIQKYLDETGLGFTSDVEEKFKPETVVVNIPRSVTQDTIAERIAEAINNTSWAKLPDTATKAVGGRTVYIADVDGNIKPGQKIDGVTVEESVFLRGIGTVLVMEEEVQEGVELPITSNRLDDVAENTEASAVRLDEKPAIYDKGLGGYVLERPDSATAAATVNIRDNDFNGSELIVSGVESNFSELSAGDVIYLKNAAGEDVYNVVSFVINDFKLVVYRGFSGENNDSIDTFFTTNVDDISELKMDIDGNLANKGDETGQPGADRVVESIISDVFPEDQENKPDIVPTLTPVNIDIRDKKLADAIKELSFSSLIQALLEKDEYSIISPLHTTFNKIDVEINDENIKKDVKLDVRNNTYKDLKITWRNDGQTDSPTEVSGDNIGTGDVGTAHTRQPDHEIALFKLWFEKPNKTYTVEVDWDMVDLNVGDVITGNFRVLGMKRPLLITSKTVDASSVILKLADVNDKIDYYARLDYHAFGEGRFA